MSGNMGNKKTSNFTLKFLCICNNIDFFRYQMGLPPPMILKLLLNFKNKLETSPTNWKRYWLQNCSWI